MLLTGGKGQEMKLIFLRGPARSGKTTTLTKLYYDYFKEKGEHKYNDFTEVFAYKGKRIGIATGGDSPDIVKSNVEYFLDNKCDIGITACRTKGEAIHYIDGLSKKHGVNYIYKAGSWMSDDMAFKDNIAQLREIINSGEAELIYKMINTIVKK